jgi:uncharacterized protein involved in exopolysaccharide biosynthesis
MDAAAMVIDSNLQDRGAQQAVGIAQILAFVRRRWLLLSVCGIVGGGGGGVLAFLVPERYESAVVVSIAPSQTGGNQLGSLGALASQSGGLASLVGLSFGTGTRDAEVLGYLQSDHLLRTYIETNDLESVLVSPPLLGSWRLFGGGDSEVSSQWQATMRFKKKVRTVTQDSKTRLITLKVVWTDPELAAKWANGLIALANRVLREKAINESTRNVHYLEQKLATMNQVEIRQGIFGLVQSEIGKEMLAEGTEEYAFRVVDPAVSAERPASPVVPVWVIVGGMLGVAVAGGWLLFVQLLRSSAVDPAVPRTSA